MELNNREIQNSNMELATFYVGDALCGIDILNIQEINKNFDITNVPQAAEYITGILNLRGKIVTIIDLARKLDLSQLNAGKENRNILVNSEDEHIGLMVDSIGDVVQVSSGDIEPPPSNIKGIKGKFFSGVLKTQSSLIGILDLEEVLQE